MPSLEPKDELEAIKQAFEDEYFEHDICGYEIGCIMTSTTLDDKLLKALQSFVEKQVRLGRPETVKMALRACPSKDDRLREWLEQYVEYAAAPKLESEE